MRKYVQYFTIKTIQTDLSRIKGSNFALIFQRLASKRRVSVLIFRAGKCYQKEIERNFIQNVFHEKNKAWESTILIWV